MKLTLKIFWGNFSFFGVSFSPSNVDHSIFPQEKKKVAFISNTLHANYQTVPFVFLSELCRKKHRMWTLPDYSNLQNAFSFSTESFFRTCYELRSMKLGRVSFAPRKSSQSNSRPLVLSNDSGCTSYKNKRKSCSKRATFWRKIFLVSSVFTNISTFPDFAHKY